MGKRYLIKFISKPKKMGQGESHSMNVQPSWKGRFEQNGMWNEMFFNHMVMDQAGRISGNGGDAVGGFNLSGQMNGSHCQINKQYHGAHTVFYEGNMDTHGMIRG